MLTERDVLIDVIRLAPENSEWIISTDSWEEIPNLFREFSFITCDQGWKILLNNKTRNSVIEIVEKFEIYEKIVHQQIIIKNETIFKSYDHMSCSFIKTNFPDFSILTEKYKELELLGILGMDK
jgi:hypothetical protein